MEGWARDISETGISAFVAQGLMVGELASLEIPLASSHWHSIPAKVARCIGTQYGFQFTALGRTSGRTSDPQYEITRDRCLRPRH